MGVRDRIVDFLTTDVRLATTTQMAALVGLSSAKVTTQLQILQRSGWLEVAHGAFRQPRMSEVDPIHWTKSRIALYAVIGCLGRPREGSADACFSSSTACQPIIVSPALRS